MMIFWASRLAVNAHDGHVLLELQDLHDRVEGVVFVHVDDDGGEALHADQGPQVLPRSRDADDFTFAQRLKGRIVEMMDTNPDA